MRFKLKSIVFLLVTTLLTGCVAAVVTGAVAGMVYDRRGIITMEADARLFHLIHKAIVTNRQFSDSRVLVTSFNRVVLLVGQTPTASLRNLAEKIARTTPGVHRVYNELSVGYPIPLTERSKDSWITGQVRSMLLAKKGLESGSIRIVTENKVVYLMGIVNDQQAALAVDAARRVNGVSKVVKIFQYIH
ncbi:BON domain-containing protein [Legionella anisa]|uniref:BON domain-containing protein n=1 Tax=Legionella anisa TaxID=28082 RepID=A0AAX0WYP2_9GAMM|nr:BON domain-containing protein [Legionella anisa]AWN72875.1 BON domain-containing protein [Legionella anisa]KTC70674.1 putative lipoprotein [Legionella anisa]MBN5934643.1 BON domain-containing protein [Legionella anisa]MCW8423683.1 BON domain-containing protein [Legionella anisa]MCW8447203.1 BON domain-containing protein [Legionella anisa]